MPSALLWQIMYSFLSGMNTICQLFALTTLTVRTKLIIFVRVQARVAELVDALVLGTSAFGVGVRLPPLAPVVRFEGFLLSLGSLLFFIFSGPLAPGRESFSNKE